MTLPQQTISNTLAEQVLAGLIAAPAHLAEKQAHRIEVADFPDWRHRKIFEAYTHCEPADHPEPGSVIIQINAWLLDAGHYRNQDDGLRQAVTDLASITGHPGQLSVFVTELIESRFRQAVGGYADSITGHAERSPLEDIDVALQGIGELRRLRARIADDTRRPFSIVKENGAA